jgi:hypothetical protein
MKGDGAQAASRAIPKNRISADRILRSTPITPRSTFITPPFNSSLGRRGELLRPESTRRPLGTERKLPANPPWVAVVRHASSHPERGSWRLGRQPRTRVPTSSLDHLQHFRYSHGLGSPLPYDRHNSPPFWRPTGSPICDNEVRRTSVCPTGGMFAVISSTPRRHRLGSRRVTTATRYLAIATRCLSRRDGLASVPSRRPSRAPPFVACRKI